MLFLLVVLGCLLQAVDQLLVHVLEAIKQVTKLLVKAWRQLVIRWHEFSGMGSETLVSPRFTQVNLTSKLLVFWLEGRRLSRPGNFAIVFVR